ncbi:LOW QUALITY PROTEIN: large ribosomal subunit protein uL13m-like [Liolophura sinensis]|uniref:LOW QUALITY PROTEIN: large ribosomal subunit protein uL13m-like n=1 Tax=Liolophura sinensis TaxID=3198878 RepID=UPI00315800F4
MAHNRVLQWATFARTWWIYDAAHQCPHRSGDVLVKYLMGVHKPIYHPLSDVGDHVVVFNTKHIAMEGDHWRRWKYFHHTQYPGGFSQTSAWRLHEIDKTKIMYKEIYARIKGNLLRGNMMRRLHLYPEDDIPDDVLKNVSDQIRQVQIIPKRLGEFTEQEIKDFPKLFDWPEDFLLTSKESSERKPSQ